ncbi:B3 domain-containing protein [Gossypium australe]|uniref:B3 domain-containing protein n=1 Tax=Gossypium australe TaxID=47621 RepID=A0A5B6X305_9ROSI|nr:B3 domain-containing protein [Gossypium australe]
MFELKGKEKVDDGDRSWLELLNGVEASTSSESEKLQKLTQMVLPKFVACLVMEIENKMMVEKESHKSCHEIGVEEGKQDYLTGKQKKQKTSGDRKKKQKINNQRKREDPKKFMEMGLEPPPNTPQVFKDCIEDLGESEIKLVIQKFLQVTDLRPQQNRLSMSLKQIRSTFLNENEERMLNAKRQMLVLKNNRDSLKPNTMVQIWSFRVQPNSEIEPRQGLQERGPWKTTFAALSVVLHKW